MKLRNYHFKMKEEFELIAKTFQGLEEVLAKRTHRAGSQQYRNRKTHGIFYRRQGDDV